MNKKQKIYSIGISSLIIILIVIVLLKSYNEKDSNNKTEIKGDTANSTVEEVVVAPPIEVNDPIPFNTLVKTDEIKKLEDTIALDYKASTNNDGSIEITAQINNMSMVESDNVLNHFNQSLVFDKNVDLSNIKIEALHGSVFPNDKLKVSSSGRGENLSNKLNITLMDINIGKDDKEIVELYKLSFVPSKTLKEMKIQDTQIKTEVYILDKEDETIEIGVGQSQESGN